jgi:hypothetical protein
MVTNKPHHWGMAVSGCMRKVSTRAKAGFMHEIGMCIAILNAISGIKRKYDIVNRALLILAYFQQILYSRLSFINPLVHERRSITTIW